MGKPVEWKCKCGFRIVSEESRPICIECTTENRRKGKNEKVYMEKA